MNSIVRSALLACVLTGLSACSGSKDLTCDEVEDYQRAKESKAVEAPEGLDDLDPLRQMAVPEASPREPRPKGSPCFDRPPEIKLST